MARTVLLADDSVTAQNMGRRILIDAGYEVVTVNNGSAALKRIHENPPDLIVLDVYMPGYGGLEVCQRLKESEETAKIPILLTVGKMEPFKTEEAKRARADAHIIKPFDASELLAALTRLEDRIVPQSHSRGRKSKPEKEKEKEKKTRSARQSFDPAMGFDDTHSEKIAYLEQVKQRHATDESPEDGQETFAEAETPGAAERDENKTEHVRDAQAPDMPRPMSVYAAEELREMPVVAEAALAPLSEESGYEHQTNVASASTEETNAAEQVEQQPVPSEQTQITSAEQQVENEPHIENVSGVDAGSPAIAETAPAEATGSDAGLMPAAEQTAEAAVRTRWIAENVAVSAEEAGLELEREMHAQAATVAHAEDHDVAGVEPRREAVEEPATVASEVSAGEPNVTSNNESGATFAAAAAASAGAVALSSSVSESAEPPVGPEAAAAWENWQHIRESVMGSHTAVQLSESIAEAVQAGVVEAPQSGPAEANLPQTGGPASADDNGKPETNDSDDAALASIVDSVLAELKPKLMAEISRKLKK